MHFDSIVIGAGSMGMAAGYYLAKEGYQTLCIDAHTPPHDFGSHHGETRLIRYAYGEGEKYVPFVLRAKQLWEELAQLSDKVIFRQVGILNFTPKNDPYMVNVISSAEKFNLPVEVLTAEQANERWKGLSFPENLIACFEPTSGVLMTENIIKSYYELGIKEGLQVHTNDGVASIQVLADERVEVTTKSGQTFTANNIIISVGAWAKSLLAQIDIDVPITPTRKTFAWFEADEELYGDQVFPGFAYIDGTEGYYGFPSINGAGLKMGRHDEGEEVNPDETKIPFGEVAGDKEDLHKFLGQFMPNVGKLKFGKTCMYSMTPDGDFIIDVHPKHKNIAFAGGFSGHGFKFASAVGEALKDLVTTGTTKVDLEAFSVKRFSKRD